MGRGGPVYAVTVESVNDRKTATSGPISYPACAIQVGDRLARVWLADDSRGDATSPVALEGDAVALKEGILVERSWSEAIVHKVTDAELDAGAAVVYVPGHPRATIVELRFARIPPHAVGGAAGVAVAGATGPKTPARASVDRQHNFAERLTAF